MVSDTVRGGSQEMPMRTASRRVVLLAALLVVSLVIATACVKPLPPSSDPAIRGVITQITRGASPDSGAILVVWHDSLGDKHELDALVAGVDEETEFFNREGGVIAFSDLKVRAVVDVWVKGGMRESYPPQGHAAAVRVIGTFDEIRPLPIPPGFVEP